jgi:hypothetical protein
MHTRKGTGDLELSLALHRELGRRPWDAFMEHVDPCDKGPDGELRRQLMAAVLRSSLPKPARPAGMVDIQRPATARRCSDLALTLRRSLILTAC